NSTGEGMLVRAYIPGAISVEMLDALSGRSLGIMAQDLVPGLFIHRLPEQKKYRYRILWAGGSYDTEDPYAFGPLLGDMDLYLDSTGEGMLVRAYIPGAISVEMLDALSGRSLGIMAQDLVPGLFIHRLPEQKKYRYRILWAGGSYDTEDPYAFGPLLGDMDLY